MNKLLTITIGLTTLLFACGEKTPETAIEEGISTEASSEELKEIGESFSLGEAKDAEEYFIGLMAEVVAVDVKYNEIWRLDDIDADKEIFLQTLEEAQKNIEHGRSAISVYTDRDWPLRAEFHDLTLEWFATIERIINDYLYDLAGPMSRLDETWTEAELELYEQCQIADEDYENVDARWVDFQYVFAEKNAFELGNEPLDQNAIIEDEINSLSE